MSDPRRAWPSRAKIGVGLVLFFVASCTGQTPTTTATGGGGEGVATDAAGSGSGEGSEPTAAPDAGEVAAPEAEPECAGDADCAGLVDEPCGAATCEQGACIVVAIKAFVPCDDGDACTQDTVCTEGLCAGGAALPCDDDEPCTEDGCDPASGCNHAAVAAGTLGCDDGNACTTDDACAEGSCQGVPAEACACEADEDCAGFEDDDLCNGTLRCTEGQCAVDASTLVECGGDEASGPCVDNVCLPETGACEAQLVTGVACSDGNPCTEGDTCDQGQCIGTAAACTCEADADCAVFDDEDLCNGSLHCSEEGQCVIDPDSIVTCEASEDPCTAVACAPSSGSCESAAADDGTPCDDGDACTAGDLCAAGVCAGVVQPCDDGNGCTEDACDPAMGCVFTNAEADCDDGDACTFDDACQGGTCAGTPDGCDDGDACTEDSCEGVGGCAHSEIGCEDDDPCTEDGCDSLTGCSSEPVECDDADPCTDDDCSPEAGCSATPTDCDDGTACTDDDCDPAVGCTHTAVDCDDEDGCTADQCDALAGCVSQALDCDDGDPCTSDGCDPLAGCTSEPYAGPCDDGDLCTLDDVCADGVCAGTADPACVLGDCCAAGETPGCDTEAVQDCVCALDSFCCQVKWDGACAEEATLSCDLDCPTCGDGSCDEIETCLSCPGDCDPCAGGDCCEAHGATGCDVGAIQSCVCDVDPLCCQVGWDEACVLAAELECGQPCPACGDDLCEEGETCETCAEDCGACVGCGDGLCEDEESCGTCAEDCGACEGGDCCVASGDAGCSGEEIAACACTKDPFCCQVEWDGLCVDLAIGECGLDCGSCGDETCDAIEDCETCEADCGACACGDGSCNGQESCLTCQDDCCEGDCCEAQPLGMGGCGDLEIVACTCGLDPYCCEVWWDGTCVQEAEILCGAPCSDSCGDGLCDEGESCETCAEDCGACAGCGDGFCLSDEDCVGCAEDCGPCEGDCCSVHEGPACNDSGVSDCVCDLVPSCCATGWSAICAAAAASNCGVECVTGGCGDGICQAPETCTTCADDCGLCPYCGDAQCDSEEGCVDCPQDCGVCSGECCTPNLTPGCDDVIVSACVCALDTYCCQVQWDAACALGAQFGCGASCDPPVCGDDTCSGPETCFDCEEDCGACFGDCCSEGESPGCADLDVTACVCALDDFCCGIAWDTICAEEADESCGAACSSQVCGDGSCTGTEDCASCTEDCGACPFCGDGSCDAEETCGLCAEDCDPCFGDCCDSNGTPGCEDEPVTACVCALDDYCCETEWDTLCVQQGIAGCGLVCAEACGDDTCAEDEHCGNCPFDCGFCQGECCSEHLEPGCSDPVVTFCTCELDGFCCELAWDAACIQVAEEVCGLTGCEICGDGLCEGEEDCEGCPADCGTCATCGDGLCLGGENCGNCAQDCGGCTGSCCSTNATHGCDDAGVSLCVCHEDVDPFCCSVLWDFGCVIAGAAQCGSGCVVCGDGICTPGEEGCTSCEQDCGVCTKGSCCEPNGPEESGGGCDDFLIEACTCALDPYCCETDWDEGCVETATYDCEGCPSDGLCCEANGSPLCDDKAVEACVCAIDSFCCTTTWDIACAAMADFDCDGCGDGGPVEPDKGPCCLAHESAGCDDLTVELCVCVGDPSCCSLAWDAECVAAVEANECGSCEPQFGQGSCCTANGTPGCNELAPAACVCALVPACCDLAWDESCSDMVLAGTCSVEGVCPVEAGLCCEANDTPGCEYPALETCVCTQDIICCEEVWHEGCAEMALECGLPCTPPADPVE